MARLSGKHEEKRKNEKRRREKKQVRTQEGRYLRAFVILVLFVVQETSRVRVGTVHLESMKNADIRAQQLSHIFQILTNSDNQDDDKSNCNNNNSNISSNSNTPDHIFLMGDFNFDPSQRAQEQLINQHNFTDTWPVCYLPPPFPMLLSLLFLSPVPSSFH